MRINLKTQLYAGYKIDYFRFKDTNRFKVKRWKTVDVQTRTKRELEWLYHYQTK